MQIGEDVGSGTKQDGVAGLKGSVSDILGHHGFAQAIGAHEDEVAGFGNEVQGKSPFDGGAVDFAGPAPIEVGHGAEATDASHTQSTFQGAARAFLDFRPGEFFPVAFWAWDGSEGDDGPKASVSTWYYARLEPPASKRKFVVPPVAALLAGVVEVGLARWARRRRPDGDENRSS